MVEIKYLREKYQNELEDARKDWEIILHEAFQKAMVARLMPFIHELLVSFTFEVSGKKTDLSYEIWVNSEDDDEIEQQKVAGWLDETTIPNSKDNKNLCFDFFRQKSNIYWLEKQGIYPDEGDEFEEAYGTGRIVLCLDLSYAGE